MSHELSLGLSCGKLNCKITHAASKGAWGSVPFLFLVDVPYSAKFLRDRIFAEWPFTKFRHAQSDAAAAAARNYESS